MKIASGAALEAEAMNAARDLLGRVPNVEGLSVRQELRLGSGDPVDGLVEFEHGDESYALVIEIKVNGAPRVVRSAVHRLRGYLAHAHESGLADSGRRLIPMFVSTYLSSKSRAICRDHEVAYLDLLGNARLAFGPVYIERAVAGRPKPETRALRSIFSPKAGAILRVLLRDPDRAWRVTDLVHAANVSLGHVSNVRKALLDREWIRKQDGGIVLTQPDALLKTWREEYRQPAGPCISGYTRFHGDELGQRLSGKLNSRPPRPRAVYSSHSAAQWFAPFARSGTLTFYADRQGASMVQETLELTQVPRGANAIVRIPTDESLFEDAVQPAPGVFCASPIITYLDLWTGNDRDREAAEHLAAECFSWS